MMILRRAVRGAVAWAVAVLALATAPAAVASPARVVPDGVYRIALGGDGNALLTHISNQQGSPTVLLPTFGDPGPQEWEFVRDSRTSQLIRNLRTGLYLGLGGREPQDRRPVVASPYPFSWSVRVVGSAPERVHIYPVLGGALRLDRSPRPVHPPRVDIQAVRDDGTQEWVLVPRG
ncbi:hypothetical protein AB0K14_05885 [Actinosynnema sp. NPDC050801]|uniref:hypothetical protein n=1 Tax=unclassified Actinosynnema TaxID=2637065 RepID=UPI0033CA888C